MVTGVGFYCSIILIIKKKRISLSLVLPVQWTVSPGGGGFLGVYLGLFCFKMFNIKVNKVWINELLLITACLEILITRFCSYPVV